MNYEDYRDRLLARVQTPDLPFTTEEYEHRLNRVRSAAGERDFDLLLVSDPADIFYLTGYTTFEVSVQCVLLLSQESTLLIVPAIEMGPAVYCSRVDRVVGYPWEAATGAAEQLVNALAGRSGGRERIGVDLWSNSLRPGLLEQVRSALPELRLDDMGDLIDRIHLVKSEAELDYLQRSADLTLAALDAAVAAIHEGVTDQDIARAGASALIGGGSEFMSMQPIVTTGFRSGIIHTNHAGHRVGHGDAVFMEFGAACRRYTAPLMRTAVVGKATPEMEKFHAIGCDVLDALMRHARTGARFDDAARAGEQALSPIADRAFFSGVFGYPVGAQFPPSWVAGSTFIARGNSLQFEDDMVFHLPICLRRPGQWGIGFSETVRITADGATAITANDHTLRVIA